MLPEVVRALDMAGSRAGIMEDEPAASTEDADEDGCLDSETGSGSGPIRGAAAFFPLPEADADPEPAPDPVLARWPAPGFCLRARDVTRPGASHVRGLRSLYPGQTMPAARHLLQTGRAASHTHRRRKHSQHCRGASPPAADEGGMMVAFAWPFCEWRG